MISHSELKQLLRYAPETGHFFWIESIGSQAQKGTLAGWVNSPKPYVRVTIEGRTYSAHRLAWFYTYGEWPTDQLDHIDCDHSNNRLSNLRRATNHQNLGNRRRSRNNKSGFKGVYYKKDTKKWEAAISSQKTRKYLGLFDTPEQAHEAYKAAAIELFGDFARFA